MIDFKVKITGDDKKERGQIIREIAFGNEAAMKLSMSDAKHGRKYKRGNRTHTASRKGEAPAVDTGFLINSIQTQIISDTRAETTIGAEYAEALEYGTSKMDARPFVEPAIEGVIERLSRGGIISSVMR